MSRIKRFLGTTLTYFIGNVLSKLVSFFLLPLYTSQIAPEQYGSYDLVLAFLNLIAPLAFFQIWDGMFRRCFDFETEEKKYDTISNTFFVCAIGTIIYFSIFFIVQIVFSFDYYIYAAIYGFFFSIHYLYGYICRVFLNNKLFVYSGLANTIISSVCNIIFILLFDWGVKSLYLAPAIGVFVQIIIIELRLKPLSHFRISTISKPEIFGMLKFSVPLCFAAVSYWLLSGYTKVMINTFLSSYENGLFAVATRFGSVITLLVTVFQFGWNELAYMMADDANRVDSYNACIEILLKFVAFGGAASCIFIKLIFPFLIDSQYRGALAIIPATVLGTMFNSMAGFLGTLFLTEKRTGSIMNSTLLAAVLNVILGYILTKYFGLHGATIALGAAFLLLLLLRVAQARRKFNVKINVKDVIINTVIILITCVAYYIVHSTIVDIAILVLLMVMLLLSLRKYIALIFSAVFMKKDDKTYNQLT